MSKIKFDGADIESQRKYYSVSIPKWMRRKLGRSIRRYKWSKDKNPTRSFIVEPNEKLNYWEALAGLRADLVVDWNNL